MRLNALIVWLCTTLWSVLLLANAASFDSVVTLDEAIALTLERHPALAAADHRARAMAARIRGAALQPPLRVGIELEDFAGTGSVSALDGLQTTLSLSRILELGDKSQHRVTVADNEARLVADQLTVQRLDLIADTARRFVDVIIAQERLAIVVSELELARETLETLDHRVRAGKSATVERDRGKIVVAEAQLNLTLAESEVAGSRQRLVAQWAARHAEFSQAQGDLFAVPQVPTLAELEESLERFPDLARQRTAIRLAEAREQLARASLQPDVDLSAGIRYLNDLDDAAFVVSANIPFGWAARARPQIDEAVSRSGAAQLDFQAGSLDLYHELAESHRKLVLSQVSVEALNGRIVPLAQGALAEYRNGYRLGRYSYLDLVAAQRALIQARRRAVQAAGDYHRLRVEIDRLTGAFALPEYSQ